MKSFIIDFIENMMDQFKFESPFIEALDFPEMGDKEEIMEKASIICEEMGIDNSHQFDDSGLLVDLKLTVLKNLSKNQLNKAIYLEEKGYKFLPNIIKSIFA